MQRTTVELPDEQMKELERIAIREGRTVAELVVQAVQRLLEERARRDADWGARLDEVVARIRAKVPTDIPPEEIEADITAAFNEVREERRRARGG